MKKLFLMAAFAAFTFAANAQTEPTASTNAKAEKKSCQPSATCCAKKADTEGTASVSANTEAVKSVSKSKSQKMNCSAEEKAACMKSCADKAAKAEKVTQ